MNTINEKLLHRVLIKEDAAAILCFIALLWGKAGALKPDSGSQGVERQSVAVLVQKFRTALSAARNRTTGK
ncbi:MAG: hypothetical protein J6Q17_00565, partial [Clostridia bacterium]|nr:hypothetical protein [Clostridia bacterium]